jgi:hypothetical protein
MTGQFLIDDEVLASVGVDNLDRYSAVPGNLLRPDLFLE